MANSTIQPLSIKNRLASAPQNPPRFTTKVQLQNGESVPGGRPPRNARYGGFNGHECDARRGGEPLRRSRGICRVDVGHARVDVPSSQAKQNGMV